MNRVQPTDPHAPSTLVVIPSRFASSRLPGKALAEVGGDPVVWRVYQAAVAADVGPVVVATDDTRIRDAVVARGGEATMTSAAWRCGSERVAEVAGRHPGVELVIDVQGDEALLDPSAIVALWRRMAVDPDCAMGTVATALGDRAAWREPSVVKVELDADGRALAFWRTPPGPVGDPDRVHRHLGLYGFRRDTLLGYLRWEPTPAERAVSLEQLRAMDHGVRIDAVVVAAAAGALDTPADLRRIRRELSGGRGV